MGNSSSSVAYALRFVLVVLVSLAFGLVLGYSATPAMRWLGKRIAVAETRSVVVNAVPRQASVDWPLTASPKAVSATSDEGHPLSPTLRADPNVQDSRLGRPVQTDDLRVLSSVRTVTHSDEHWETGPNWDYCGNPQCRLCYPVAGSFASDLPDMPQGYCKRHPQSRDCKPIVVPAPKPLPKATDPPVIASAGLGVVSRETLAWVLVCVFFVAWIVSGFEVHKLRKRQTVSDFRDTVEAAGLARVRRLVQDWLDKQGHDRCWYYPEIFTELARALDLQHIVLKPPQLPSLAEFRTGCERYQREQYPHAVGIRDFQLDNCQIVVGKTTFRSKIRITVDTVESIVLIEPLRQISIDWVKDLREVPLPVSRPIRVSEGHIPEAARCDPSDLCSLHKPCAKHGGKLPHPALFSWGTNSDERGTDKT